MLFTYISGILGELQSEAASDPDADNGSLEEQGMDYESRMLLQNCVAQQHLLSTYSALAKLNQSEAVGQEDLPPHQVNTNINFLVMADN